MSNIRPSATVRQTEIGLRRELLNRIFLKTLSHENFLDDKGVPEAPQETMHLPESPIREQYAFPAISEQNIEKKEKEEVLLEINDEICLGPSEKKRRVSHNNDNCVIYYAKKCNNSHITVTSEISNSISFQESSGSEATTTNHNGSETKTTYSDSSETFPPTIQKTRRSKKSRKRTSKKYSRLLDLIERLERNIATFCDKENECIIDACTATSGNNISIFQNITSSEQKNIYKRYHGKTTKVCNQLQDEISLYSQYIDTLELAVNSVEKDSKLYKMLEAKLKKAHKFHRENPCHEKHKTLECQLKLVYLLIKKFESENID